MTAGDLAAAPARASYAVADPVADGCWTPAPALPCAAPPAPPPPPPPSDLASLSRPALEARLAAAEAAVAHYAAAARAALGALALGASANAAYCGAVRAALVGALGRLPAVASVEHCECSMPALDAEAPDCALVRFDGLAGSEWDLDWAPASWWVDVRLTTALGLCVAVHVSAMRVRGRVRVGLSGDLSSVRLGFAAGRPLIELAIESSVNVGYLPIPGSLRETIDGGIRAAVSAFVEDNLVGGNTMLFVLRRRPAEVSDADVAAATEAARRHASITSLV